MKTVDLFSGCGGLSLGLKNEGYNVVLALDNWQKAIESYKANFNSEARVFELSDIENTVDLLKKYEIDVIAGGPPCQDFSSAGKRIEAERASMTVVFAEIVARIKPRYFIMENVKNITNSNSYAEARKVYKTAGYGLTEVKIKASHCNVPQRRTRFFCIGGLEEQDHFLEEHIESCQSKEETTVKSYFGEEIDYEYFYQHPRNYERRSIFSVNEQANTIRGVVRNRPPGWRAHKGDAAHPDEVFVKNLTVDDFKRYQTFPSTFQILGNKRDKERQIGNAVPVNLAAVVGKALKKYINEKNEMD